jgi:hypothetical protein
MDEEVENKGQPNKISAYNVYNEKLDVSNFSDE